jgi:hypothetical protein
MNKIFSEEYKMLKDKMGQGNIGYSLYDNYLLPHILTNEKNYDFEKDVKKYKMYPPFTHMIVDNWNEMSENQRIKLFRHDLLEVVLDFIQQYNNSYHINNIVDELGVLK